MNADPYVAFQELYDGHVRDRVREIFPVNDFNAGVHATLDRAANHFHAGVLLLVGRLLESADPIWETAATLAEYSWTGLIVMDDLVDMQRVRRGHAAVWATAGMSYAAHAAWRTSTDVALAIARYERQGTCMRGDQERYLVRHRSVLRGQAIRDGLRLSHSPAMFRHVMLAIASHLGCMLSSFEAIAGQPFVVAVRRALRTLSYAASLKNDMEDIFPPSPLYSPGGIDLRNRQVTYVIKHLYEALRPSEQRRIDHWMGGDCDSEDAFEDCLATLRRGHAGIARLISELAGVVEKALRELDGALKILSPNECVTEPADVLRAWVRSYTVLGNSRIGIQMTDREIETT